MRRKKITIFLKKIYYTCKEKNKYIDMKIISKKKVIIL